MVMRSIVAIKQKFGSSETRYFGADDTRKNLRKLMQSNFEMTYSLNKTLKGNRVLAGFVLLMTGFLFFYGREVPLSPMHLHNGVGPYEGYYWNVAQFQINFERMDGQIVRFAAGVDKNTGELKLRQEILASNFHTFIEQSSKADFFQKIEGYSGYVKMLDIFLDEVARDIQALPADPSVVSHLVMRFDDMRPIVTELSNKLRVAEVHQRKTIVKDYQQKRKVLYYLGMGLWGLFLAWLAFNICRTRKLLEAEKQACAIAHDAMFAKNNFLGMISHELRTPLQTILSSIDLIVLKAPELNEADVMKRLSAAAENLEMQLKDLTDLARLDAGKLGLHEAPFDPNELIEMIVADFLPAAERKGIAIEVDIGKRVGIVISDAHRIQQIVNNLTSNAIKYTDHGHIHVRVSYLDKSDPQLIISITDTGIGIRAEYLPSLFNPFVQIDQGNTRRHEGAGMGL